MGIVAGAYPALLAEWAGRVAAQRHLARAIELSGFMERATEIAVSVFNHGLSEPKGRLGIAHCAIPPQETNEPGIRARAFPRKSVEIKEKSQNPQA